MSRLERQIAEGMVRNRGSLDLTCADVLEDVIQAALNEMGMVPLMVGDQQVGWMKAVSVEAIGLGDTPRPFSIGYEFKA